MVAPDGVRISPRRLRRFVGIAAAGVLAGVLAMNGVAAVNPPRSAAATAADAVAPGTGSSVAQTIKINPTAAALSIGVTLSQALAGHQNQQAQAESNPVDLGVIGTTLTAQGCTGGPPTVQQDQLPQPLTVSSSDPAAAKGETGNYSNLIQESVKANNTPFADAVTETLPLGLPGVLQIGPGRAEATSGLVNGERVATATVDISNLTIAGAIAINGLHWQATYSTGTKTAYAGDFTIGSLSIAGQKVPTQNPKAVFDALNGVLGSLGVVLTMPTAHLNGDALFVDPLSVGIVPNASRDAVTSAVIDGIQPIQEATFNALLQATCQAASGITVLQVVLGSITGAGSFTLELGGVQAATGTIQLSDFLGGGGDSAPEGTPGAAGSGGLGGTSGGSGLGSVGGLPAAEPAGQTSLSGTNNAASPTRGATQAAAHEKLPPGVRGGALAAVAAGVLGLVLLLAEGDRRKMRKAQRQIPLGL